MRALLGRNKKGVVALVSSIAGYSKHYSAPLYSATKHAVVGFARSMGDAEQVQGVKVVCVCPGYVGLTHEVVFLSVAKHQCSIVKTPIWTDGAPGSGTRYGITDDIALTSSAVAATIDQAIESDDIPGGTILEISKLGGTRVIPEWNIDPPPGTEDDEAAVGNAAPPEMIKNVMGPILRVTEAERGTLVNERA